MRLVVLLFISIVLGVYALPCVASRPDLTGVPVDQIDSYYGVLPPTPIGEGHLGPLSNKRSVLIRYRLPTSLPISYMLDFHNIVPMAGTGKSYQLQLRRGCATGPLVYDGPACNLYFFASTNRTPLEIAGLLTDEDIRRGYIDIYASCRVEGKDTWTMYRDAPDGEHKFRPLVINNSSQFRKRIASAQLFKDKDIHLLPVPYAITLSESDFNISSKTRILLASKSAEGCFPP